MKFKLLAVFLLIGLTGYGQSINPQVVSPAGQSLSNGSAQLTFTLGEIAVGTLTGGSNQITQGFLQPGNADVVFTVPSVPVELCSDAGSAYDLTQDVTALPSSGDLTFSGNGVTGTTFDATAQAGNTVTITATFDPDGAAGSEVPIVETYDIVVTTLPVITVTETDVFVNSTGGLFDLLSNVSADPTGGAFTFSGTGVTGTNFDPAGQALDQAFVITVNYLLAPCGTVSSTFNVTVNEDPQLTVVTGPVELCSDAGVVDLNDYVTTAVPTGGVLTFNGSTDADFDAAANIGTTTIDVQYVVSGETLNASFDIVVTTLPVVTVTETDVFVNSTGGLFDLLSNVSADPTGGAFTFSGTGVTGTNFDPAGQALDQAFVITVNYLLAPCGTVSSTFNVTVNEDPQLTVVTGPVELCSDAGVVDLNDYVTTAVPTGGVLTFNGSTDADFDATANIGTTTIDVQYVVGGETLNASFDINVTEAPTLTILEAAISISQTGGVYDLTQNVTVTPDTGALTFSGTGVTGNDFDPTQVALNTPTNIDVTYVLGGCTLEGSFTIEAVDGASITVLEDPILTCENGGAINLEDFVEGNPSGGTFNFTGTGVTTSPNFDPAGLSGTVQVTAEYTVTGETVTATLNVQITAEPTLTLPSTNVEVSTFAGEVDLIQYVSADPSGGTFTFSGPAGLTGSVFDPTGLNAGSIVTVNVDYEFAGCPTSGSFDITITDAPFITVPSTAFQICETGASQDLTAVVTAMPAGGTFTFTGTGVTGNEFDPTDLGDDNAYTITVEYTTDDGTDTKTFEILSE